jgi:hypothetical protein
MNKFSISMMSLVAMTALAAAQQKAPAAPAAAPTAKAGAPAAAPTAKAGAPAAAATTPAAAAKAPVAAPPTMEKPKPPAEIAAAIKAMGARKTCTGQGMGPDMAMADMKGTVSNKSDLDGWFIRQSINMTVGKGKAAFKMKMESLSTWDSKLAKWRVMGVSNDGSTMAGTADLKDGKYEFTGEMAGGMGTVAFKDHGDMTDPKNAKWMGEMSMDKGKTWTKVYEQTCK